ncbi:MAG: hypothetical protein FJY88_14215, partial [Candidatus Eisenbacteria bacterium]|nr:hypothetical protein [Candidatus Eisenbacteria bacterium]
GQLVPAGNVVFQAGGEQIDVLDVADPTSPRLLHSLPTSQEIVWLQRAGDYLYAMSRYLGLVMIRAFDRAADPIRDRAQSLILPAQSVPLRQVRMEVDATPAVDWEFSADGGAHWQTLLPPGAWHALAHPGSEPLWRATLLYERIGSRPVVDELRLEWTSEPAATPPLPPSAAGPPFALHPSAPNPGAPPIAIRFELPSTSLGMLEILDVSGRRLRLLAGGPMDAGRNQAIWDGRDDQGRPLPAGIYTCRLRAGGREEARKLTLIE